MHSILRLSCWNANDKKRLEEWSVEFRAGSKSKGAEPFIVFTQEGVLNGGDFVIEAVKIFPD